MLLSAHQQTKYLAVLQWLLQPMPVASARQTARLDICLIELLQTSQIYREVYEQQTKGGEEDE